MKLEILMTQNCQGWAGNCISNCFLSILGKPQKIAAGKISVGNGNRHKVSVSCTNRKPTQSFRFL